MNFLAKFFAWFKPAQEAHAPQDGYSALTAAKFFRQIITVDLTFEEFEITRRVV